MDKKYFEKKINALISETKRAESALVDSMVETRFLFNRVSDEYIQKTDENINEIFETTLSLKNGYISALSDLSYQIGKLYRLKAVLVSYDSEAETTGSFTLPIDIDNLKATTSEEIEKAKLVQEDISALEPLMMEFYERGESEGKTEEQIDEEWGKFVDEFVSKKFAAVESKGVIL